MTQINSLNSVLTQNINTSIKKESNQSNETSNVFIESENESLVLTDQAKQIKELREQINQTMIDVNMQLVETIKQSLANGEYQVNHEQLADNLLNFELNETKS